MGENSKIEWCDHTFNPWWGCQKVGPGCDHCYAETLDNRFGGGHWGAGAPRRRTSEQNWNQPRKWNEAAKREGVRKRVFCASMADVFDNAVPEEWRCDLWKLVYETPHLDWLLLTKRIGNARDMLPLGHFRDGPLPNLWLGITVVNQEEANRDIPKLQAIPATIRFLSCEPLLGPVNISEVWDGGIDAGEIHWVIVGGESGRGARPMHPRWARSLLHQCLIAGIPFLFKQWGEWAPGSCFPDYIPSGEMCDFDDGLSDDDSVWRVGKKAAGRLLDGKEYNDLP